MAIQGINIPLDAGATIVPLYGKTGNNTAREDSPSAPSPAVIYKMKNVMPSELGYSSAFDTTSFRVRGSRYNSPDGAWAVLNEADVRERDRKSTSIANMIKLAKVQRVVPVETGSQALVYMVFTEQGLFAHNPAAAGWIWDDGDDSGLGVYSLIDPITSEDPDLFHLWTTAVVDDRMFAYFQGQEHVYIIGDTTLETDSKNWKGYCEVVFTNEEYLFQVLKFKPTFLNMEGQVGLFQASNRLGFWDSDNAVAWSSAFDKTDFTPDVISLAGITTFAGIQGRIVNILPTADGFNIYCSSSILSIHPISGEGEHWGARPILSGTGIDYYFQAAVGTDPTTHFAWTRNGLYAINNGQAQTFKPEVYKELTTKTTDPWLRPRLYALTVIGREYLIISEASEWREREAVVSLRTGKLEGTDKEYTFYLSPYRPFDGWWSIIDGNWGDPEAPLSNLPAADWEPDSDLSLWPPANMQRPLIPCFSGYSYVGPINPHLFNVTADDRGPAYPLTSNMEPALVATRKDTICNLIHGNKPNEYYPTMRTLSSIPEYTGEDWMARKPPLHYTDKFYDSYGQEFMGLVQDSIDRFAADMAGIWNIVLEAFPSKPKLNLDDNCPQVDIDGFTPTTVSYYGWEISGYSPSQIYNDRPAKVEMPDIAELHTAVIELRNAIANLTARIAALTAQLESPFSNLTLAQEVAIRDEIAAAKDELAAAEAELIVAIGELDEGLLIEDGTLPLPATSMKVAEGFEYHEQLKGLPFTEVGTRTVQDSCGIKVYAYIDDFYSRDITWMDPVIYEEAQRGCDADPVKVPFSTMEQFENGPFCSWRRGATFYTERRILPASLKGKTFEEREFLLSVDSIDSNPCWVPVFEATISGMGWVDHIGSHEHFVKTISRARLDMQDPTGNCRPDPDTRRWLGDPKDDSVYGNSNWDQYWESGYGDPNIPFEPPEDKVPTPEDGMPNNDWEWPYDIHYAALFQRGVKAPYYPIYEKAWVLDLTLDKWGSMDWPHSSLFVTTPPASTNPTITGGGYIQWGDYLNLPAKIRAGIMPFGIVPKFETPSRWFDSWARNQWGRIREELYAGVPEGTLLSHQLPTFLLPEGTAGEIVLGGIAMTREGSTKLTGISGKGITRGFIDIRGSFHGESYGSMGLEYGPTANDLNDILASNSTRVFFGSTEYVTQDRPSFGDFRAPFVLVGKEFEIRIRGLFRLDKLICYGEPTGRLAFWGAVPEGGHS